MHRVGVASSSLCLRSRSPHAFALPPSWTPLWRVGAPLPVCGMPGGRFLHNVASSRMPIPCHRLQSLLRHPRVTKKLSSPWRGHLLSLSSYSTGADEGRAGQPLSATPGPADASPVFSDGGTPVTETLAETAETLANQTNLEVATSFYAGIWDYVNPVGWVAELLGMAHGAGLPWWGAIVVATAVLRTFMLPLVVQSMKNAANMRRIKPEMDALKRWYTEQGGRSNPAATTEFQSELGTLMSSNNVSMLKGFLVPLVQAPVFISFFFALRRLAVEDPSLATGGFYPFIDLSTADPLLVAPALTALTMWATIELGSETGGQQQQLQIVKWVFRGLAVVMFPLTMGLPKCVHLYWFCSNIFSLGQLGVFKAFPGVKTWLGIPIVDEPAKGASVKPVIQPSFTSRPASKTSARNIVDSEMAAGSTTTKGRRAGRRRRA